MDESQIVDRQHPRQTLPEDTFSPRETANNFGTIDPHSETSYQVGFKVQAEGGSSQNEKSSQMNVNDDTIDKPLIKPAVPESSISASSKRQTKVQPTSNSTQLVSLNQSKNRYCNRKQLSYDDKQSDDEQETSEEQKKFKAKVNPAFRNYSDVFYDLLLKTTVKTAEPIVSIIITYDSQKAVVVSQVDDQQYFIRQFGLLPPYKMTFEQTLTGEYVKLKQVEQNADGSKYAIGFNDNGKFYVRTFTKDPQSEQEALKEQIDLNSLLNINNFTMCSELNDEPYMNVCFVDDTKLYVALYHNYSKKHYHFMLDLNSRTIIGTPVEFQFPQYTSKKNFPFKSMYNDVMHEIYTVYRQGESFVIKEEDLHDYDYDENMSENSVGEMFLIYNKILAVGESNDLVFYQIEEDEDKEIRKWVEYHSIPLRGSLQFIKGNRRFQLVSDDKIYFYYVDEETCEVELENAMFNFMHCSQIMFGPQVKFGITFKSNQNNFNIYQCKYTHDFKVSVSNKNFESAKAFEIESQNIFVVGVRDDIMLYHRDTFHMVEGEDIPIQLMKSDGREQTQVLGMQKCYDERHFAIITGKMLIMEQCLPNQLYLVRLDKVDTELGWKFAQVKVIILKDIPQFKEKMCMDFNFTNYNGGEAKSIVFVNQKEVFELDLDSEMVKSLHVFKEQLKRQPSTFDPTSKHEYFLIASPEDGLFLDMKNKTEDHFMKDNEIESIKTCIYDEEENVYYVIANKYLDKMGFFVLKIDPKNSDNSPFIIKWKNRLDIDDAQIFILHDKKTGLKELIIGCKIIYINVYSLFALDISVDDTESIQFRHESFQMYESECSGLLLNNETKDYIHLNNFGMYVSSFASAHLGIPDKRVLIDDEGQCKMLHAFEACNFLRLDPQNYIYMECHNDKQHTLRVRQEFIKNYDREGMTHWNNRDELAEWTLFNVKIDRITLREALVFKSLEKQKRMSDIEDIVKLQPKPAIFFKSFYEFDFSNMVSILSFNQRAMNYLLSTDFDDFEEARVQNEMYYPLFYKNKINKGATRDTSYFYRNAVEIAYRNHSMASVQEIIQYIVNHQNYLMSSFIFLDILPKLIESGIKVSHLLQSNVFCQSFELDGWPTTHDCDEECIRAYNMSIFQVRKHYRTIFHEEKFKPPVLQEAASLDDDSGSKNNKLFKIEYQINILPMIGQHFYYHKDPWTKKKQVKMRHDDVYFTTTCAESDEIEIFRSECLQQVIEFKWNTFVFKWHLVGTVIHFLYLGYLLFYASAGYVFNVINEEAHIPMAIAFFVFCGYPLVYECVQIWRLGFSEYMSDLGNYMDLLFIFGSVVMSIVHMRFGHNTIAGKYTMIIVVIAAIKRSFNYLRIFRPLSTIVTMMNRVIFQLWKFMVFFLILCLLISLMYDALGIGNVTIPGDFQRLFKDENNPNSLSDDAPNAAYKFIGLFVGNFFETIRMSTGDFAIIDTAKYLDQASSIVFWILFVITVIIGCVIFLNFIVAEASGTYNEVSEFLDETIQNQLADMIGEAESIYPDGIKNEKNYPRYLVIRKVVT